ncbi:MAG TPA: cystatin domain-containing protein [Pyrinomonadaceae bacterium]|nr:cystatin domain-containing protein [Pyrinomonadaceae bacterium]
MRKLFRAALFALALGVLFGSAAAVGARRQAPRVGGYKQVATNAAEVVSAAKFAVAARARKQETEIRLVSVETAERQTVAGANYRLCLKVEESDAENNVDVTETVRAVVYRSLQNAYTLKNWEPEDCAEEE